MIWFPWIAAYIAKRFPTSSWRFTHHVVTALRPFDRPFAKWAYFRIYCNPSHIGFIFSDFFEPFLNQIARSWRMKILLTSETENISAFTSNVLLAIVDWLDDSIDCNQVLCNKPNFCFIQCTVCREPCYIALCKLL